MSEETRETIQRLAAQLQNIMQQVQTVETQMREIETVSYTHLTLPTKA